MKIALKSVLALAVAIAIMLMVRAYAFTLYSVESPSLDSEIKKGDKVIVNRLLRSHLKKGETIVFFRKANYIGVIEGLPGDTVDVNGKNYILPERCPCNPHCVARNEYMLVKTADGLVMVHKDDVVGKAYKIWR